MRRRKSTRLASPCRPMAQGEYRVSVLDDGTTQITVRSGSAEIFSPRGSEHLGAGHSVLVRGNPSDPEFQETYEIARDQFDDWSATRDRELLASQSYKYVSHDIYGADDLDAYGNWVPSQYGQVWEPRPPSPDWSPYSSGQWAWENYYGWTWVDNAPWGWAPYHYGRWFWNGGAGWCWWPGAIGSPYLWSPALVGFFGWGGLGLGFAGLGWVALAPFEIFHAWWGHGWGRGGYGYGGYGRGKFGMLRNANIAGMYRNAGIRGGAMTAGYNGFGGPNQRFSAATRGQLSNASLFRGQMPVSPSRTSYQFSNRQAAANPRLASSANRQFFHQQSGFQSAPGGMQRGLSSAPRRGMAAQIRVRLAGCPWSCLPCAEIVRRRLATIWRPWSFERLSAGFQRGTGRQWLAPLRRATTTGPRLQRRTSRNAGAAELRPFFWFAELRRKLSISPVLQRPAIQRTFRAALQRAPAAPLTTAPLPIEAAAVVDRGAEVVAAGTPLQAATTADEGHDPSLSRSGSP